MPGPRTTRDEETVNASERAPEGRLSLRVVLGSRAFSHELPRMARIGPAGCVGGRGNQYEGIRQQ